MNGVDGSGALVAFRGIVSGVFHEGKEKNPSVKSEMSYQRALTTS